MVYIWKAIAVLDFFCADRCFSDRVKTEPDVPRCLVRYSQSSNSILQQRAHLYLINYFLQKQAEKIKQSFVGFLFTGKCELVRMNRSFPVMTKTFMNICSSHVVHVGMNDCKIQQNLAMKSHCKRVDVNCQDFGHFKCYYFAEKLTRLIMCAYENNFVSLMSVLLRLLFW